MTSPFEPSHDEQQSGDGIESPADARELPAHPGQPPRLGILHLLLWMLGSAVILAVWRALDVVSDGAPTSRRIFHQVMLALHSMLYGMSIAGLPLIYLYRRRNLPYPYEPGHWLLLISGLLITFSIASHGLWRLFFGEPRFSSATTLYVIFVLMTATRSWLRGCLSCLAAIFQRKKKVWLIAFAVIAAADVFRGIGALPRLLFSFPQDFDMLLMLRVSEYSYLATWSIAGLAVGIAAGGDLVQRNRRDWAHWTGVFVMIVGVVFVWAWQIGIWVIQASAAVN